MSTLIHTLLASIFPVLFAPEKEFPTAVVTQAQTVVTVKEEQDMNIIKVYFYHPV